VTSSVNVPTGTGRGARSLAMPSPLQDPSLQQQYLPILLDKTSTSQQSELAPRVNVNTAPQAVLSAIATAAGLSDATSILSARPDPSSGNTDPQFQTMAWLLTQANLPIATIKKLDPLLTSRSQVYRMQVVGYFPNGGPSSRVEAVVDTNMGRPRIVYVRNLGDLGKGFDLGQNDS
jgi:hypothetical protein